VARDLGDSDHFLADDAVVKQHLVTFAHRLEIIARLKISHAGPSRFSIAHKIVPRISGRLLFHHPVLFFHNGKNVTIAAANPAQAPRWGTLPTKTAKPCATAL